MCNHGLLKLFMVNKLCFKHYVLNVDFCAQVMSEDGNLGLIISSYETPGTVYSFYCRTTKIMP